MIVTQFSQVRYFLLPFRIVTGVSTGFVSNPLPPIVVLEQNLLLQREGPQRKTKSLEHPVRPLPP
jgi:hypothetical protein